MQTEIAKVTLLRYPVSVTQSCFIFVFANFFSFSLRVFIVFLHILISVFSKCFFLFHTDSLCIIASQDRHPRDNPRVGLWITYQIRSDHEGSESH